MTSHGSRPSGCTGYTPFEQELVNSMNDFVNGAEAPHFDTAAIARGARRKRATAIAGIATALVVAGTGTALAIGTTGGSHDSRPAAHTSATTDKNRTTVQYGEIPIQLAGFTLDLARPVLVDKAQLKIGRVIKVASPGCKPGTVIAVSPHAPTVVHKGDTVNLTLCAG
ncbi:hypothetical protein ACIQCJ_01845 [Streptomyces sp. NPDC093221]|uniref:hypothetical protein n=1 Tax=unclassified Streptomyces TaxID=2593676 RepID=UPI003815E76E